jgi:hypothetical protein
LTLGCGGGVEDSEVLSLDNGFGAGVVDVLRSSIEWRFFVAVEAEFGAVRDPVVFLSSSRYDLRLGII